MTKKKEKAAQAVVKGQWGGVRKNQTGRPRKADELRLIEKLTPLEETAHIMLAELVEAGNIQAIKLYFEYMYGKPKQIVSVEQKKDETKQVFIIGGKQIEL